MRKIMVMLSVSLDGFIEDAEGSIDWHLVDEEWHTEINEMIRGMSALLEGRVTFEMMHEFWPTADSDPESTPATVEFAGIWRDIPKFVFSKTMESTDDPKATMVRDVDPAYINELKSQPGGDMLLGGPDLVESFMEHDLIDGWILHLHPIILGDGKRLFPKSDERSNLRLVDIKQRSTGVVTLRYERP